MTSNRSIIEAYLPDGATLAYRGGKQYLHVACTHHGCDHGFEIMRPFLRQGDSGATTKEATMLARGLEGAGWTFKNRLRHALCPTHSKKEEKPVDNKIARIGSQATQPTASFVAGAGGPSGGGGGVGTVTATGAGVVHASGGGGGAHLPSPTPQPTQAGRRAISDELDAAYDAANGRYRGVGSDEVIAKKLNVPRKWVTDVREFLFGPERNENDDRMIRALAEFEARIAEGEKLVERGLDILDKARKDIAAMKGLAR